MTFQLLYNIAWYEQMVIIVLFSIAKFRHKRYSYRADFAGILSTEVVEVLVERFGTNTISTIEEDMKVFEF